MVEVVDNTEKIADALQKIVRNLTNAKSVQVGFPADATYPDGTPVALVAAIQEFGAPSRNIPPRPFMRSTIAQHESNWVDFVFTALPENDFDARKTLGQLGDGIRGQLQQSIKEFTTPPNAPSTLRKKAKTGFTTPLQETQHMLESVTSEVE